MTAIFRADLCVTSPTTSSQPLSSWAWSSSTILTSLEAINGQFDVLLTVDKNMRFQNNIDTIDTKSFMVVVFEGARSNRYEDLQPFVPALITELATVRRGQFVLVL